MNGDAPSNSQSNSLAEGRVLPFRRPGGAMRNYVRQRFDSREHSLVADLAKYERDDAPDDYRHRMTVNAVALVFVVALVAVGIWFAETLGRMRKDQDCVLSGQRNCAHVEIRRPNS